MRKVYAITGHSRKGSPTNVETRKKNKNTKTYQQAHVFLEDKDWLCVSKVSRSENALLPGAGEDYLGTSTILD